MTSAQKIRANRANAQASTGPRTAQGKARIARNARRHGLSLSVISDPVLSEQVEVLARKIAGEAANEEIYQCACRIAEAQIDLQRIRYARHQLLSRDLSDPDYDPEADIREKLALSLRLLREKVALCRRLLRPNRPEIPIAELRRSLYSTAPQGLPRLATILLNQAQTLQAMDRYERRALSRRKFAIRALDLARRDASANAKRPKRA